MWIIILDIVVVVVGFGAYHWGHHDGYLKFERDLEANQETFGFSDEVKEQLQQKLFGNDTRKA